MDGATIQARIYAGRGEAALRMGLPCRQYRPLSASAPLANLVGTLPAAFNATDPGYGRANLPGNPLWYADLDGRTTAPGDYLVRISDGAAWFIAAQQQLLPILCVDCSRAIRITRQQGLSAVGVQGYSGNAAVNEVDVLGAPGALWPASILLGGHKGGGLGLPSGSKEEGFKMMLPPSVPITILAADIITDDVGRRYVVEGAELTDSGWRITSHEVHS